MNGDPHTRLLAALDTAFASLGLTPSLVGHERRAWYSITFAGQQRRFRYALDDGAIEPRLDAALRDHEFDITGCLVADIAVRPCAGGFEIELLTIEDD